MTSNAPLIKEKVLQGLSLRDVTLSVLTPESKKIVEHRGDMIFTHFGLSGPIALRCSQFVVKTLEKTGRKSVFVSIDFWPDRKIGSLMDTWWKKMKDNNKKTVRNALKGELPDRIIPVLLQRAGIDETLTCAHLSREQLIELSHQAKQFLIPVNGTLPMEKAFVTGGGVHVKEIQPKTMESRLMDGLYFCGEILDIHGYTGGYNITAASCTGYVAGKSAAEKVLQK